MLGSFGGLLRLSHPFDQSFHCPDQREEQFAKNLQWRCCQQGDDYGVACGISLRRDLAKHQEQQGDDPDGEAGAEVAEMLGGHHCGQGRGARVYQIIADQDDDQRPIQVALHAMQRPGTSPSFGKQRLGACPGECGEGGFGTREEGRQGEHDQQQKRFKHGEMAPRVGAPGSRYPEAGVRTSRR
nr:hypothetical protein [Candidatus Accumulibacter phosphatis]